MKSFHSALAATFLAAALAPSVAGAGEGAAPPATSFRAEYVRSLEYFEKKIVGLLQAFPQDKLGWRPAEGVKAASEIFMHLAQAPKAITGLISGTKPDIKALGEREKSITDKAAIEGALKEGFAAARQAAEAMADGDLEATVKAPWGTITKRYVLQIITHHAAEHLGQLSIYARVNGIVPPWRVPKKKDAAPTK